MVNISHVSGTARVCVRACVNIILVRCFCVNIYNSPSLSQRLYQQRQQLIGAYNILSYTAVFYCSVRSLVWCFYRPTVGHNFFSRLKYSHYRLALKAVVCRSGQPAARSFLLHPYVRAPTDGPRPVFYPLRCPPRLGPRPGAWGALRHFCTRIRSCPRASVSVQLMWKHPQRQRSVAMASNGPGCQSLVFCVVAVFTLALRRTRLVRANAFFLFVSCQPLNAFRGMHLDLTDV